MGNSNSQEEDVRRGPGSGSASRPASALKDNRPTSKDDHLPQIPHSFERAVGRQQQATTAVNRESVTAVHQEGSLEFSHIETVEPAKPKSGQEDSVGNVSESKPATTTDTGTAVRPGLRRKSTILLEEHENELEDDEQETRKLNISLQNDGINTSDSSNNNDGKIHNNRNVVSEFRLSRAGSGEEIELNHADYNAGKIATVIEWKQGGKKVYVTGSFTGWRKMIKLSKDEASGDFSTVIKLPIGTHRLRFVVDNEMRCSDYLPTATDSMGNLVNYIEVGEQKGSAETLNDYSSDRVVIHDENSGTNYERFQEDDEDLIPEPAIEYGNEIPPVFTDPEIMDRFVSSDFVTPPQLPPHLEGVILNSNSTDKDNNSVLPIPNHVVLNHLATTSIKHNVLAVASISRYSRKYVTQILYAPL